MLLDGMNEQMGLGSAFPYGRAETPSPDTRRSA